MFHRLYAIADRETLTARGVDLRMFSEELRDAGVRLLQYRDKKSSDEDVLQSAREIAEVFAGTGATLIMNDRVDLAAVLGWGVHVGQGDMPVAEVRAALESGDPSKPAGEMLVGVSTHHAAQVAEAERGAVDYVAIGPVFATTTKANPEPVVGLEGVQRARTLTVKPLVAIGGITLTNARSVREAGADSVAVIGGLFVPGRSVRAVAEDFLERLR